MKKSMGIHERLYPNPVVLVSSSFDQKDNIITIAWAGTVCSQPPLIAISIRPSRFSHHLIKHAGEFVINIPKKGQENICEYCGTKSGQNIDKFKQLKLGKAKPFKLKTPLIEQCPIHIECKLKDITHLGTHDLFIGEVVDVSGDPQWVYSDGDLDYDKLDTLTYCMGKYFSLKPQS